MARTLRASTVARSRRAGVRRRTRVRGRGPAYYARKRAPRRRIRRMRKKLSNLRPIVKKYKGSFTIPLFKGSSISDKSTGFSNWRISTAYNAKDWDGVTCPYYISMNTTTQLADSWGVGVVPPAQEGTGDIWHLNTGLDLYFDKLQHNFCKFNSLTFTFIPRHIGDGVAYITRDLGFRRAGSAVNGVMTEDTARTAADFLVCKSANSFRKRIRSLSKKFSVTIKNKEVKTAVKVFGKWARTSSRIPAPNCGLIDIAFQPDMRYYHGLGVEAQTSYQKFLNGEVGYDVKWTLSMSYKGRSLDRECPFDNANFFRNRSAAQFQTFDSATEIRAITNATLPAIENVPNAEE